MEFKKLAIPVLLLFFLNLFVGLLFINEGLFHLDSVLLAKAVENTYEAGYPQPAVRGRYGAVIVNSLLYFPFFLLGQNADFAVRLSSILFHALSIVALFLLVYEIFASIAQATYASILLSFTPFYFSPNTYGKEHGMSIFFLLISFYLICYGINKKRLPLLILSGLFFAQAVAAKESVLLALPLYILLYLKYELSARPFSLTMSIKRTSLKSVLYLFVPFVIAFIIMYFAYLEGAIYRELCIRDNTAASFRGIFHFTLPIACQDIATSVPPILFLFSILGIAGMLSRRIFFLPIFLVLWFTLLFYFANIETYTPRHLDIVIIPAYIAASYSLVNLRAKDRFVADAVVAYLALSMFFFMYPMLKFRHTYNGEKRFAQYVRQKTEPNAIIISMDDSAFIEYYGKRKAISHPIDDPEKTLAFIREINGYLGNGTPVYLTQSGLSYDHKNIFINCFLPHFKMNVIGSKLSEDYHRPDLKFTTYDQKLYKIELKYPKTAY